MCFKRHVSARCKQTENVLDTEGAEKDATKIEMNFAFKTTNESHELVLSIQSVSISCSLTLRNIIPASMNQTVAAHSECKCFVLDFR